MTTQTPQDKKKIKAVIFDFDGTLADTMHEITAAMNRTLRSYGFAERTYREMRNFINYGAYELVNRAFPKDSPASLIEEALPIYHSYYEEIHLETRGPYAGLTEVISFLRDNGYKIGVLSNKAHELTVNLTNQIFGEGVFDFILGLGQFERKPAPDAGYYAAESLGVKTEEILFIGDSQVDIRFSKNTNMTSVGVTWGYRDEKCLIEENADYIVRKHFACKFKSNKKAIKSAHLSGFYCFFYVFIYKTKFSVK